MGRAKAGRGPLSRMATQTRPSFLLLIYRTGTGPTCHAGDNVTWATRAWMKPLPHQLSVCLQRAGKPLGRL